MLYHKYQETFLILVWIGIAYFPFFNNPSRINDKKLSATEVDLYNFVSKKYLTENLFSRLLFSATFDSDELRRSIKFQ